MNSRVVFRMCNKLLIPQTISRGYAFKVVKRPDPKTLKMPAPGSAPSILDILKQKIKLRGPISVADYMHIVATNPTEGYYMKKEVIGHGGDFITSPEISQLFGEILGVWFYAETKKMGYGKPLQIVELGPGKGTLLLDILRVLNRLGYQARDLSLHLVEISSTMQSVQANKLCISHREVEPDLPHNHEGETVSGIKVYWYNDLTKVPKEFSWYIAHEFFDVLPIHKFEKTDNGWRELLIDIDGQDKLYYRIAAEANNAVKTLVRPPLDSGDKTELEISARSLSIARQLAQRVDQFGGLALIADYGHEGEKGDTFRAFHKHQVVNPLENPGQCDLTADVDFTQLRIAAAKTPSVENYALVVGPVKQSEFLDRCQAVARLEICHEHAQNVHYIGSTWNQFERDGRYNCQRRRESSTSVARHTFFERFLRVLMNNAKSDEDREKIKMCYDMLVDPKKMGERFKFMAFYPSTMAEILNKYPPLGFSTPAKS